MSDPELERETRPVAVVGAGAAGLLAALTAARRGLDVVLLERTRDGGRKILISGGGRCNILPAELQPERYVTDSSPNSLRKILRAWPLEEQRRFFEDVLGMPLEEEEETRKLFPATHRARDVRDGLVARVREAGVRIWFDARVSDVQPDDVGWTLSLYGAPTLRARAVILATGGLSVPKTGSDGAGLSLARALGHEVVPTYPALTPLTVDPHPLGELAGVSALVSITATPSKPAFSVTGALLVTHRGWSGPSVLDASHVVTRVMGGGLAPDSEGAARLSVAWGSLGRSAWERRLLTGPGTVGGVLAEILPRRLAAALGRCAGVPSDTSLSQLTRVRREALVETLTAYPLPWTGHGGYEKAEVTGGGVHLSEIDARTMESRRCPGLYLCGEILDAFGPIGGHNFAWAWTTGRTAGLHVR